MHKPENETTKVVWDFEITTDDLISARRPDLLCDFPKKKKKKKKEPAKLWTLLSP